jgi:hypothetical protein
MSAQAQIVHGALGGRANQTGLEKQIDDALRRLYVSAHHSATFWWCEDAGIWDFERDVS